MRFSLFAAVALAGLEAAALQPGLPSAGDLLQKVSCMDG